MEAFNFDGTVGARPNVRRLAAAHIRVLTFSSDRLDGNQKPVPYSVLLKRPDLRHRASITK
jgi:phosphatidylinositol 3-kinase